MRKNFYLHKKLAKRISIFASLFLSMTSLSVIHIQAAVQNFPFENLVEQQSNPVLVLSLAVISFVISYLLLSNLKNRRSINS